MVKKTQIWLAVSEYALVAIIKKRLRLDMSLYKIPRILSVAAFDKIMLYQIVIDTDCDNQIAANANQLDLCD